MNDSLPPSEAPLSAFLTRGLVPRGVKVELQAKQLRGGLVSPSVRCIAARYLDRTGRRRLARFVVKQLSGTNVREMDIYRKLSLHSLDLAPELLEIEEIEDGVLLFLEAVQSKPVWPWRDLSIAARVLEKLAKLHGLSVGPCAVDDWDYDDELAESACLTLSVAQSFAKASGDALLRTCLPALRRLVDALPRARQRLLEYEPLPATAIHGDVHPGNVLVRRRRGGFDPVLIDWARFRWGSPLEDVNSWIEWLAFWEYGALRKHDTLLGTYLRLRGIATPPSPAMRDAYWTAGAINCCSGALLHHLVAANDARLCPKRRHTSLRAAHHCLRMIRRASRGSFVVAH